MRKIDILFISLTILSVLLMPTLSDALKVYQDETKTEYVMVDKLDCKAYEGDGGVTIGFKAGSMLFGIGPEVTFGKKNEIKWDKSVHAIIARYKELCTRFNSGAMTMEEYNHRIEQIDFIAKEMLEFQEQVIKHVKAEADDMFEELDRETKGKDIMAPEKIGKHIDQMNRKIEKLPE